MMRSRYLARFVPLVLVVLLLAACSGASDESAETTLAPTTTEQATTTVAPTTTTTEAPTTTAASTTTAAPTTTEPPAADVFIAIEFDGESCRFTESDPPFAPSSEEGLDLLAAAPNTSLAVVLTNTSGEDVTAVVNRWDPTITATEALAINVANPPPDGTMYDKPEFILGAATWNNDASYLSIDENQLQYHYILQPGLSTAIAYTNNGIWVCRTAPTMTSLIEVPIE